MRVHAQPAPAVTLIDPVPPAAEKDWPPGLVVYTHAPPASVTGSETPPMEMVALSAAPAFAAIRSVTVPGPLPEFEPLTVIQFGNPVALQEHPALVWIPIGKLPPEAVACTDGGVSTYEHDVAAGVKIRTRLLYESAKYTLPAGSSARPVGLNSCALVAGPLSPLNPVVVPAMLVIVSSEIFRMRSFKVSEKNTLPAESTAMPSELLMSARVAGPLSPLKPGSPVPAIVEIMPPVTLRM